VVGPVAQDVESPVAAKAEEARLRSREPGIDATVVRSQIDGLTLVRATAPMSAAERVEELVEALGGE
jgi:hypothetical protein